MIEHPPIQPQQTKRDFLKYILGGSLFVWVGTILYPVLSYLKPPSQAEAEVTSVKAGKLTDIEKDSGTIIKFGSKPVILLLDEPTASVDPSAEESIYQLLEHLKGTMTIIMVTHDLQVMMQKVDRFICVHRQVTAYSQAQVCDHFAQGLYHPPMKPR